jgi:aspartate/methionine/tyrosine aminotransferase
MTSQANESRVVLGAPVISRGARQVRESRIRRLTIEAIAHKALNLAQAFPDYAPLPAFVEAIRTAASSSRHQYTDTWGSRDARQHVVDYVHRFHHGVQLDPDANVLLTLGAMEAMNDALFVALDPGDEAVVLEPFYECFVAQILSRHGVPKFVRLEQDGSGGFVLDLASVERAFTPRTRALLLNTPANPTGKIYSRAAIEALLDICRRHGAWLISDETYEQIFFTRERPVSVADVDPSFTHSVLLTGFGKTFAVTGWRIGYIVANQEFIRAVRPPHDVNTICAVAIVQEALPTLTRSPDEYFDLLRREYRERFEVLSSGLEAADFGVNAVEGAYYIFARIPDWWPGTGTTLNDALLQGGFIAGVPGEVFYGGTGGERFIRYTFCKNIDTMREAVARLQHGIERLQRGIERLRNGSGPANGAKS